MCAFVLCGKFSTLQCLDRPYKKRPQVHSFACELAHSAVLDDKVVSQ